MKDFFKSMGGSTMNISNCGSIIVNGKTYHNVRGPVTISNGKLLVGGKPIEDLEKIESKQISITIEGNVDSLSVDMCDTISVTGNVKKVRTTSGDVRIGGNVEGDVQCTSGDVECGNVEGDVSSTSGDIHCGTVGGGVRTVTGDIRHK